MNLPEITTEKLMEYIEDNLSPDKHYYGMTHSTENTKHYELYFVDKKWKCREDKRPRLQDDPWEEFHKETAEDYFEVNKLCLDHFKGGMTQNILMRVPYYDLMISKITKLFGQTVVDQARVEYQQFEKELGDAIKELTGAAKPKLSIVLEPEEDK